MENRRPVLGRVRRVADAAAWHELLDLVDGFRGGVVQHCLVDNGAYVGADRGAAAPCGRVAWLLVQFQGGDAPVLLIRAVGVTDARVNADCETWPAEAVFGARMSVVLLDVQLECARLDVVALGREWLGPVALSRLETAMYALFDE
ncbi:hypothetical protein [Actinomadura atramentaria]|uniref:hypothetical protein n=1 Tax=Actinomadura atramentaria TaxID=1990 RepID=UPI00035FF3B5|nr:hypothetical protein [Actinomadura atramentaria]